MQRYDYILVSGGFDPLHTGHLDMLIAAAARTHRVIVGLNADSWLVRKKGAYLLDYATRKAVVENLKWVYQVVPIYDDDDTACNFISRYHIPGAKMAFGNGGDRTPGNTPEGVLCLQLGIELIYNLGGGKTASSREIITRYIKAGGRFGENYEAVF